MEKTLWEVFMDKIYVQMYSFASFSPADNEKNFAAAAELGFTGVELFGPNFAMQPQELADMLTKYRLEAVSLHAGTDMIEGLISHAKTLGLKYMGIGMNYIPDAQAAHQYAERLNQIGEECSKHGIMLTYHNHTQEFMDCDGKTIMDILVENTNPAWVGIELDAGWCAAAGMDPIAFVNKHAGRVKLIHLKESKEVIGVQPPMNPADMKLDETGRPVFSEKQIKEMEYAQSINCPAGEGLVDWKKLKEAADAQGCAAYIVERERTYAKERFDCLKEDIEYYKNNL
jgi:sugar phosphate isomerase/epimerase